MPLPYIITAPPGDLGVETWAFWHWNDHLEIVQKFFQLRAANLPTYDIQAINPNDVEGWLERHQQYHNDMNALTQQDGSDLTRVDWKDEKQRRAWFWLNFQEHNAVHQFLKI
jgi:hypothetical protein